MLRNKSDLREMNEYRSVFFRAGCFEGGEREEASNDSEYILNFYVIKFFLLKKIL